MPICYNLEMGIIYRITNLKNGKVYIGQTVRPLARRWKQHRQEAAKEVPAMLISKAIAKYGVLNFTIEPLCEVPATELDSVEIAEIEKHRSTQTNYGYNISPGGKNPKYFNAPEKNRLDRRKTTGRKQSAATILKIKETRRLMRENGYRSPLSGRKRSPEFGKQISKRLKGRVFRKETIERIRKSLTGRRASAETRMRQSRAMQGRKVTVETRTKQAAAAKLVWEKRLADPTWQHWRIKRKLAACAII